MSQQRTEQEIAEQIEHDTRYSGRRITMVQRIAEALRAERLAAAEQERVLIGFANDILKFRTETLEGCDIDDIAIKHGLLRQVKVAAPCGDQCACAETGNLPGICYRKTELLMRQSSEGQAERVPCDAGCIDGTTGTGASCPRCQGADLPVPSMGTEKGVKDGCL